MKLLKGLRLEGSLMFAETGGFIMWARGDDTRELLSLSPDAISLFIIIAHSARWRDIPTSKGLTLYEAKIGDFKKYKMTESRYRTAKKNLGKRGFVKFRGVPGVGTIAKITKKGLRVAVLDHAAKKRQEKKIMYQKRGRTTRPEKFEKSVGKIKNEFVPNYPDEDNLATLDQNRDALKKLKEVIRRQKSPKK